MHLLINSCFPPARVSPFLPLHLTPPSPQLISPTLTLYNLRLLYLCSLHLRLHQYLNLIAGANSFFTARNTCNQAMEINASREVKLANKNMSYDRGRQFSRLLGPFGAGGGPDGRLCRAESRHPALLPIFQRCVRNLLRTSLRVLGFRGFPFLPVLSFPVQYLQSAFMSSV